EQPGEAGVIELVVDDEAGIDRERRAVIVDRDGMAVASKPGFAFINRDGAALRQRPCRGIAGDSRSNNGNAHFPAFYPAYPVRSLHPAAWSLPPGKRLDGRCQTEAGGAGRISGNAACAVAACRREAYTPL